MKKTFLVTALFFTLLLVASCTPNKEEMLKNLPGYWEIEKVEDPGGNEKKFTINTTIDYIELNGTKGIRTKVNPQLDGSFINNGTTENFEVVSNPDNLILNYDNNLSQWTEEVISISKDKMVVKNEEGKEYYYKRFEEFSFNEEEEKKGGDPLLRGK